jgi:long-chain acyl-CoA synthetase
VDDLDTKTAHHRPWLNNYPAGVDYFAPIDLTPVFERVANACKTYSSHVALDFLGAETTYGELGRQIDAFCGALQAELGVVKGTRVALLLPNTPYYAFAYYAVLKAGGTVVNCNPLYAVNELAHIVANSRAEIVITLDLKQLFDKAEALAERGLAKTIVVGHFTHVLPGLKSVLFRIAKRNDLADPSKSAAAGHVIWFDRLVAAGHKPTPVAIDPVKDVAVQQYTGGTTGTPKGAMLTHANISANLCQIDLYGLGLFNHPARTVAVLPFFHIFAMTVCLNTPLANGGEVVMLPRFDLKGLLALIDRKRPKILPAVPTLLHAVATSPQTARHDLNCLEVCISGGAALSDETRVAFAKVSNGLLAEGYGLTECSPVVCCAGLRSPSKPMSIGMPLPGTDIRFVDLEDPSVEVPMGERGELVVKGPQVMPGYFEDRVATDLAFCDGWFRSGDVGYVDADGFVFLVDRIKDIIIVNGFNVYPRTIEDALNRHPAVDECNVIGVNDDKRGEVPMAFVKLVQGQHATEAELTQFLKADLSPVEMPREIVFRDHLPKTLIGKLSKKELKQEMEKA